MKLLLLVPLLTLSWAGYQDHLSQFLHEFETLAKDNIYIEHVSNFTSLTAMKLYVRIELKATVFHAALQPHLDLFHPELIVRYRESHGYQSGTIQMEEFLEGTLIDEPYSRVLIHIRDNVVSGSIQTTDGEKYFIEPSHRHVKEPHNFHMVAYKQSDVKFNFTNSNEDSGHFCGHESHKGQESFSDEDFDFMIPKPLKPDDDSIQYSRKKRASGGTKNRCPLALVGDYIFYSEVNGNEEVNAINYMIGLIQQVDPIFKKQSLDREESADFENYGFQVKYVEVVKTPKTDTADAAAYDYYTDGHSPQVSALLKNFAYGEWGSYCLAHLFTNYDFSGGVLGLAYVAAASTSRVGGVCTRTYIDGTGNVKSLNVGLTTSINYGRALLSSELVFVTGHELGHNWGSSHDSDTSTECAPASNRYLMYPAAVDGSQNNNYLFSPCSKQAINDVLVSKADICFETDTGSFCGNGVVEGSEECDAGLEPTSCCSNRCNLIDGADCEDTNTECCSKCKFLDADEICLYTNSDNVDSNYCLNNFLCDGAGGCKNGTNVSDGVQCYDNGACLDGECKRFCEYKGKESCSCQSKLDNCKQCCREKTEGSICEVDLDGSNNYQNLTDGKLCTNGMCYNGNCKVSAQDIQEKFWEVIDQIDINMVLRWFKNNIVFTIIIFTSIFWIPISFFVNWLDNKYDLGYLDEWLGGDDDGGKKKRGILLGSTAPADTATNIYPRIGSTLAGSRV